MTIRIWFDVEKKEVVFVRSVFKEVADVFRIFVGDTRYGFTLFTADIISLVKFLLGGIA